MGIHPRETWHVHSGEHVPQIENLGTGPPTMLALDPSVHRRLVKLALILPLSQTTRDVGINPFTTLHTKDSHAPKSHVATPVTT